MSGRPDDDPSLDPSTVTISERPSGRGAGDAEALEIDLPTRFEVRRVIGRGGMGVVLEVLDRHLGREVAVKLLAPDKRDPVHQVRFRREAKAAGVLRHPNIVTVHDVDTERDFIVMELVRGESLRARIRREGKLAPPEVRRIALALLDGLAAAHDARIIHRDVKPANILIDDAGVVKLVDFGIASFGDRDLTSTGVRIGTPAYMAPEQLRGRVAGVRVDVYAVGATLFEAATGVQLHGALDSAKNVREAVVSATGDIELAAAIERAVAERPEDRFPDVRSFARALGAQPADGRSAEVRAGRGRRWPFVVAAAIVATAAAIGVGSIARRDRNPAVATGSADAGRVTRVIAMLPFVDHTREPQLDFTPSGLPHILAEELRSIPEVRIVGYHDIADRLTGPSPTESAWGEAARALGAELIVRGELFPDQAGVRLVVVVETIAGKPVGRFERMTTVKAVHEATRALAADVARAAVGRPTAAVGVSRELEIERSLQHGIAAIERQDLTAAKEYLKEVELKAPDLAEAQYYLALLNWWLSADANPPARRALAGNLDPAQRGVMEGLLLLINQSDMTQAIEKFRALTARFPDHRDTQYGLFESLYHGGYGEEAMAVYRRLGEQHPPFRLGLKHALAYHICHAIDDGIEWVTARLDDKFADTVVWQARARVARRDYAGAIAVLRRHEISAATAPHAIDRELLGIYLVDAQLGLADDLVGEWPRQDLVPTASSLLALSTARGRTQQADAWREKATAAAALATGTDELERGWLELAALALPDAHPAHLRPIAQRLETGAKINDVLAYVLVTGALGDHAVIDAARASKFPEVVAITDAYRAEWAKDWKRAATGWRRSADLATDGLFLIIEQLGVARASRATKDHAAVMAACDEVIRPRRFTWAWSSAVGPCLRWSAEAATELGRAGDARTYWERLLALRADAAPGDELVQAARDGLARSR